MIFAKSQGAKEEVDYIVTELTKGGDLFDFIIGSEEQKLDEDIARIYFKQILNAVAHCHQHGIAHRDIKMENILLDETKQNIKLIDFGFAK